MIAIIDYGAGNLYSVKNALDFLDIKSVITQNKNDIMLADAMILPGVGAFPNAMRMLNETNLIDTIKNETLKKPLLGICLGMQMLFDYSNEFQKTEGLGLIEGYVDLIKCQLKMPHIGFNNLEISQKSPLLNNVMSGESVYFVHSFMAYTDQKNVSAYCDYEMKIPALVQKGNVFGAQFHPEKSGDIGLEILKNFRRII